MIRSIKADGPGPGDERMIDFAIRRLVEELGAGAACLAPLFRARPILVPVPPSAPVLAGGLWIPRRICEEMRARGLGTDVVPLLRRRHAIPKSAYAPPGKRPTLRTHEDSLELSGAPPMAAERLLLVDDVVTKGAALLGAASVLSAAMAGCELSAFALVRTMGLVPDVERLVDPCLGKVARTPDGLDAHREP